MSPDKKDYLDDEKDEACKFPHDIFLKLKVFIYKLAVSSTRYSEFKVLLGIK